MTEPASSGAEVRVRRAWSSSLLFLASCTWFDGCDNNNDPDPVWERFNADDDVLTYEVTGEGSEPGGIAVAELHSSTGEVVIGRVTADPGSGPVGTVVRLSVEIDEEYADQVDRVEFDADAGERGTWTMTMEQDSAELGLWVKDIQSHGDEGEVRTDVFTVWLWHLEEDPTPTDAATAE